jgi:hypothetical protein
MYVKDTVCINHPSEGVTSSFRCQQGVKQGCPLNLLLFGLIDVHVWLLFFIDDLILMSKSKVGLQQQLDTLQQFVLNVDLQWTWKKQKSWCSIMLTHAKSLCLKVTLLNVCKPSNTWGSYSKPPRTWIV